MDVLDGGGGDRVPGKSDEREVVVEEVELAIEETGVVSVMEDVVVVEVEEVVDGGGGVREIECDCELVEWVDEVEAYVKGEETVEPVDADD